jgi:hypothetical protein
VRIGDVAWPPGVVRSEVRGRFVFLCVNLFTDKRTCMRFVILYDV